jgi:ATP-dependent protease HslVU (ClpYQ) peptidase subunit
VSRFKLTRMSKKHQDIMIEIKKLLFELPLTERITLIERLGKQLRQQNSIETNREVNEFRKQWNQGKVMKEK